MGKLQDWVAIPQTFLGWLMSNVNDFDLQAGEGVGLAVRVHPAKDDAVGTRGDFSDFGESGGFGGGKRGGQSKSATFGSYSSKIAE